MRLLPTYCLLITLIAFSSCEKVYISDADVLEAIVVDARLSLGSSENIVRISMSKDFNDISWFYEGIDDAKVQILDSNNDQYNLVAQGDGNYLADFALKPELQYKIRIQYQDDVIESDYQAVPDIPDVDTIYGNPEVQVIGNDGGNKGGDFNWMIGLQMYMDKIGEANPKYYLFHSKHIMQTVFSSLNEEDPDIVYSWETKHSQGIFNIAAPPEYGNTTDIENHPLLFVPDMRGFPPGKYFRGWIIILYQHNISKSTYDYYKDLNSQLGADGKLFDPMYVQARNNLVCVNNPRKIILGNFEISSMKEYRFYHYFYQNSNEFFFKEIPYFYPIPANGNQTNDIPDFWESPGKTYPDE